MPDVKLRKGDPRREFLLGVQYVKKRQYLEGMDRFRSFLGYYPKRLPEVLVPLYKFLLTDFNNLHIRLLIADLFLLLKRYDECILELEDAIDIDPAFTQSYYLLSKVYKETDIALKHQIKDIFVVAFDKGILDSAIIDTLSKFYLGQDNRDEAISFFNKLIEYFPDQYHQYKVLAELYIDNHSYEEAAEVYHCLCVRSPKSLPSVLPLCEPLITYKPKSLRLRQILVKMNLKACSPDKVIHHVREISTLGDEFLKECVSLLKEALSSIPEHYSLFKEIGSYLIRLKEYSEGVLYLQKAFIAGYSDLVALQEDIDKVFECYPAHSLGLLLSCDNDTKREHFESAMSRLKVLASLGPKGVEDFNSIKSRVDILVLHDPSLQDLGEFVMALYYSFNYPEKASEILKDVSKGSLAKEGYLLSAQMASNEGDLNKSRQLLLSVLDSDLFDSSVHQQLRELRHQLIQKRVSTCMKKVAKSTKPDTLFDLGLSLLERFDWVGALENFQKITDKDSLYIKAQILISRCFLEMGRFDLSKNQLMRLLPVVFKAYPELKTYLTFHVGVNLLNMGEIPSGICELEKVSSQDITFPGLTNLLSWYKKQSFLNVKGNAVSGVFEKDKIYILTVPSIEATLPKKKRSLQSVSFAQPHNHQGIAHILQNNFKAAEESLTLALQLEPGMVCLYCNFAILSLALGDPERGLQWLLRLKDFPVTSELVPLNWGLCLFALKRYSEALEKFEQALAINSDNKLIHLNIGDVYAALNNYELAMTYWAAASTMGFLFNLVQRRILHVSDDEPSFDRWIKPFDGGYFKDKGIKVDSFVGKEKERFPSRARRSLSKVSPNVSPLFSNDLLEI